MFFFALEYLDLIREGLKKTCLMVLPEAYFPQEFKYPYLRLLRDPDNDSSEIRYLCIKILGHDCACCPKIIIYKLFVSIIDCDWQAMSRAVGWCTDREDIAKIDNYMRRKVISRKYLYGVSDGSLQTSCSYRYLLLCSKKQLNKFLGTIYGYVSMRSVQGCIRDVVVGDCTPICPCWSDEKQYIYNPLNLPSCKWTEKEFKHFFVVTLPRCPAIHASFSITTCKLCKVRASNH
jgi:hypothetical protein